VDVHVQALLQVMGHDERLRLALAHVRDKLYCVVCDGEFTAGRIHGDYWPGNLLFSGVKQGRPALVGIVDWEASGPAEAPLHDVVHLVLYTRRLITGQELGEIISEQLHGAQWSAEEGAVFDAYGDPVWEGLSERDALLLYWLRQMSMHIRQQAGFRGWRFSVWRRRNLHTVLESL
jgi:hypothetical protein